MSEVDVDTARAHCLAAEIAISEAKLAQLEINNTHYKPEVVTMYLLKHNEAIKVAQEQVWSMVRALGGPTEVFKKVTGGLPNELSEKESGSSQGKGGKAQ